MEQKKIEADTSKYYGESRIVAAAACIEAQRAGKKIQYRIRGGAAGDWSSGSGRCDFSKLLPSFGFDYWDYRVKPEPVRETREFYVAYSNVEGPLDFTTREAALDYLRRMYGECRVDRAFVDYEDGVEVARRVRTAGPR